VPGQVARRRQRGGFFKEISEDTETVGGSLADYRRDLVDRIAQQTVTELAREKGITPDARRRWLKLIERTAKTAWNFEKDFLLTEKAVIVPILGREEEPEVQGPKS
jgi:hypothetical protein